MYESFYNFSEKPFTLLPDPGFLYLSDKHRMALTLLEYGLMNQAGFTVISGDIGAGKTTLIRHVLDNMDREHTVGLISNTHQSFGELLQWILLAFNLEHANMSKVEMYQRFVDFIVDEYAQNRRTVLIVDEAQNMDAATLEELRMLSNVNADKDQALQVILVGQRELRETLRRPDLVQFAQRISVDYHLEPLSSTETANYIRHRLEVAGGSPDIFNDEACDAVYRFSGGVPRLINLLCDTALVYGFAEQKQNIDAQLVEDVAREKQQGGIFPTIEATPEPDAPQAEEAGEPETIATREESPAAVEPVATELKETRADIASTPASRETPAETPAPGNGREISQVTLGNSTHSKAETATTSINAVHDNEADYRWKHGAPKKKVRLALCSTNKDLQDYLGRLLESYGLEVVSTTSLEAGHLALLDPARIDILLIDRPENTRLAGDVSRILGHWTGPVIYNDSSLTDNSLRTGNTDFGKQLVRRINTMTAASPDTGTVTAINH